MFAAKLRTWVRANKLKSAALVMLPLALGLGVWSLFIEPSRLVVHHESIDLEAFDGPPVRIVIISDIHFGAPHIDEDYLDELVALANTQEPDVVALLGDFVATKVVGASAVTPEQVAAKLEGLHAEHGVYAVLGNHDWWFDGPRSAKALSDVGIRVLQNEGARVGTPQPFWFAGVDDYWTRNNDISAALDAVTDDAPVVIITHSPDLFDDVPPSVALTLAGHTHGGQVHLPVVGSPVVPSAHGQRFAAGHIDEQGKRMFVTTGVGTSLLPLRLGVPPELVVLELR